MYLKEYGKTKGDYILGVIIKMCVLAENNIIHYVLDLYRENALHNMSTKAVKILA